MRQVRMAGLAAALTLVTMLGVPALAVADGGTLRARLRGFQEVPAVSTEARGEFRAKINNDETAIEYELSYGNLQGTVTQSHIHFGQLSVNGGIVVFLCQTATNRDPTDLAPVCPQAGTLTGKITAANVIDRAVAQGLVGSAAGTTAEEFAEFIDALRAGVTYVNVHTSGDPGTGFPSGEIRGKSGRVGAMGIRDSGLPTAAPEPANQGRFRSTFGLLRIVGKRQMMAQRIARRSLVPPLMHKEFRACHPRLASSHMASVHLHHHKCARA